MLHVDGLRELAARIDINWQHLESGRAQKTLFTSLHPGKYIDTYRRFCIGSGGNTPSPRLFI